MRVVNASWARSAELVVALNKGGRNNSGRITTRHQGGGHKRRFRVIDFVRRDKDGVPHIFAESRNDALFGLGFVHAQDRLWQMDTWRKRGLGLLAGDLGAAYVERDQAARLVWNHKRRAR